MKLHRAAIEELAVEPGAPAALDRRSTTHISADWLGRTGGSSRREVAERDLEAFKDELESAQELLYAGDTWALLVIFQALDAAGKDGTIAHVMSGVNPQGCEVVSFKQPSAEELRHDFLWRCAKALPERGRIGIFNRSYYEDVLVARVHPELIADRRLPGGARKPGRGLWKQRYEDINAFERHLHRNGTRIVKLFLHLSKDEQRRRFLRRLDDPAKRWKFSADDLGERAHFDEYQQVYEEALTATATRWAPWYVVPADHKPRMRALVAGILVHTIEQLDLKPPVMDEHSIAELDAARDALLREVAESADPGEQ
jgi:PPK2 family polyphosphate:nucleotide phosphotransferase